MTPYKWQETAAARFVKEKIHCLWVDCGCGKTLAEIIIACRKALPAIVIAPGHLLCEQWKDALFEMGETDVWIYNRSEERRQGEAYAEAFTAWIKEDDHGRAACL